MLRQPGYLQILLVLFVTALPLACGQGGPRLVSVTVTPANASAQTSSRGAVQFVASGKYSDGSVITPLPVLWSVNYPWLLLPIPGGVSLSTSGIAQCVSYIGSIPVVAVAPEDPNVPLSGMNLSTGMGTISGAAKLTCK
jgi:hypothetical protein